jgi:hypothetical protein
MLAEKLLLTAGVAIGAPFRPELASATGVDDAMNLPGRQGIGVAVGSR